MPMKLFIYHTFKGYQIAYLKQAENSPIQPGNENMMNLKEIKWWIGKRLILLFEKM